MAGVLLGGGVGMCRAEWMIHGEPEADVYGMDVARYGKFAENKEFIKQTTGQFYSCLLYTSPSPRDLSTSRMPSSA